MAGWVAVVATHSEAIMGFEQPRLRFGFYLLIGAVLLALAHDKSTSVCAQVSGH